MPLDLAANEFGSGPPVAILHGLFGSGRNWRSVAQHLAARHRVLTFDLRNHGASPWADGMSYGEMVEDLRASLRARGIDHAALVAHSMGGKAAMLMALLHPAEVDRLVIVDIAPAANPPNLLSYIRAMRAVDLRGVKRRAEIDVALAGAVPDPAERAFLLQNLLIDENAVHWRLNLKAIERDFPQILGFPDLPRGIVSQVFYHLGVALSGLKNEAFTSAFAYKESLKYNPFNWRSAVRLILCTVRK